MKLDIVIPSKGRIEKLTNCINSILLSGKNLDINLYLYFSESSELNYFKKPFKNINEIKLKLLDNYRVPDFWNSHLQKTQADALLYLNDDVLLFEDTLPIVFREFPNQFPDFDGVMGLRQANLPQDQTVEGAFGVIGLKYAERFPDRKVWCPDYNRLHCDHELWRFAKSIDKFVFCSIARIEHLHPAFSKEKPDATHIEVRKWRTLDKLTYEKRKSLNYLWGQDFNLVNA